MKPVPKYTHNRPGDRSSGSSALSRLWNTLSCTHISVEINDRKVRAFSRAYRMVLTIEVGLSASMT